MAKGGRRRELRIVDPTTHPRREVSLVVAAEYLEIHIRTLHKLIDAGHIRTVRKGCYQRVPITELVGRRDMPIGRAS